MEPSTILGEIADETTTGGRACPVSILLSTSSLEERDALTTALADPARYSSPAIARVFRRRYPQVTVHAKAVTAHRRGDCRCSR